MEYMLVLAPYNSDAIKQMGDDGPITVCRFETEEALATYMSGGSEVPGAIVEKIDCAATNVVRQATGRNQIGINAFVVEEA